MRCTTKDFDFVYSVIAHPDVWDHISDDITRLYDKQKFVMMLLENPAVFVLAPEPKGMVGVFHKRNSITYEGHQQALPEMSGRDKIKCFRSALDWMFQHTACKKIMGFTPEVSPQAVRMAALAGMKREGLLSKSWLHNGQYIDQVITGVTKEEFYA